jgi:hypothetical protein
MRKSVAPEQIASAILVLRGHRVLLMPNSPPSMA